MKLYMAVTPDRFELPLAVGRTAGEVGRIFGINKDRVLERISREKAGERNQGKHSGVRFVRVELDDIEPGEEEQMTVIKPERVRSYYVTHPAHGKTIAFVRGPEAKDDGVRAIMFAAGIWDVPWTKIAAYCDVERFTDAWACTCRRCHRAFTANMPDDFCPGCRRADARAAARLSRDHFVDRRVSAGTCED